MHLCCSNSQCIPMKSLNSQVDNKMHQNTIHAHRDMHAPVAHCDAFGRGSSLCIFLVSESAYPQNMSFRDHIASWDNRGIRQI